MDEKFKYHLTINKGHCQFVSLSQSHCQRTLLSPDVFERWTEALFSILLTSLSSLKCQLVNLRIKTLKINAGRILKRATRRAIQQTISRSFGSKAPKLHKIVEFRFHHSLLNIANVWKLRSIQIAWNNYTPTRKHGDYSWTAAIWDSLVCI